MRVLVADDDRGVRQGLAAQIRADSFEVVCCSNGGEAIDSMTSENPPRIAVIDLVLPDRSGVDVCRTLCSSDNGQKPYIIMLTVKNSAQDIAQAFDAGASDYVTKPFSMMELRTRIRVGRRVVELDGELRREMAKSREVSKQVRQLAGMLPVCSRCRESRDDADYRQELEEFMNSHVWTPGYRSLCPACATRPANNDGGQAAGEDLPGS